VLAFFAIGALLQIRAQIVTNNRAFALLFQSLGWSYTYISTSRRSPYAKDPGHSLSFHTDYTLNIPPPFYNRCLGRHIRLWIDEDRICINILGLGLTLGEIGDGFHTRVDLLVTIFLLRVGTLVFILYSLKPV